MNFSLGFFVGGQVLAGILGSVVTYGYGVEGKHGANYMQTMAASVATMSGMAVLVQAMKWLGIPEPPVWQLFLYFTAIGMFGVGVGMLYTPVLVDRMQLPYPSGFAVANILRALTDKQLLHRSLGCLCGGTALGFVGGLLSTVAAQIRVLSGWGAAGGGWFGTCLNKLQSPGISTATLGAGMVVGVRIALPVVIVGYLGLQLTPWLRQLGWLGEHDPFRKIGFIIALGMILGAALVDLTMIGYQAAMRFREKAPEPLPPQEDWKRTNTLRLILWVAGWGLTILAVGSEVLRAPIGFVGLAILLTLIFVLINGISLGISDNNPISSAFVISVFVMAMLGLKNPGIGLMCAAILLISCGVGADMQQDRSTGWRLGTNRVIQFRYQVTGILMGAFMAVLLAKLFMQAYPVLQIDTFTNPNVPGAKQWQSAMTYKFVGALRGLTNPKPYVITALAIGLGIGFVTEILRQVMKTSARYRQFARRGRLGSVTDFVLDAVLLPSPYASSFGGFVDFATTVWFALGGVISSLAQSLPNTSRKQAKSARNGLPEDMSATALIGGGLIAGDSLAALSIGLYGLLRALLWN
jgi:uncharacterized oligopeptide transporter (OPT) family protein